MSGFYNNPTVKRLRAQRRKNFKRDYPLTNYGLNLMANKIPKLQNSVNVLKELVNVEFKAVDHTYTGTTGERFLSAGSLLLLNGCSTGDGYTNRDGRSIRIKSVDIKVNIFAGGGGTTPEINRILIFIDKDPNASQAGITDVLSTNSPDSPRNLDFRKRFVILKDKRFVVVPNQSNEAVIWKYYKKLNMHTIFNADTGATISAIQSNALYMMIISDQPTGGAYLYGSSRVRFIDN